MFLGIFEMWRTDLYDWELGPPREPPLVTDGLSHLHSEAAVRNIDFCCRCMLRSESVQDSSDMGPITFGDGVITQAPSEDEDTPDLHPGAPASRPPFGCLKSSSDLDADSSGLPGPRLDRNNGIEIVSYQDLPASSRPALVADGQPSARCSLVLPITHRVLSVL